MNDEIGGWDLRAKFGKTTRFRHLDRCLVSQIQQSPLQVGKSSVRIGSTHCLTNQSQPDKDGHWAQLASDKAGISAPLVHGGCVSYVHGINFQHQPDAARFRAVLSVSSQSVIQSVAMVCSVQTHEFLHACSWNSIILKSSSDP